MTNQRRFVSPYATQPQQLQQQFLAPPAYEQLVPYQPPVSVPRYTEQERLYGVTHAHPPQWLSPPVGACELECDHCQDIIEEGAPVVELFCGRVGRSWKTGQAGVVNDLNLDFRPITLHLECVGLYAYQEIPGNDWEFEMEEMFCHACNVRIEQDLGEGEE